MDSDSLERKREFDKIYKSIMPRLEKFENQRYAAIKEAKNKLLFHIGLIILGLAFITSLIIYYKFFANILYLKYNFELNFIVAFIIGFLAACFVSLCIVSSFGIKRRANKEYKKSINKTEIFKEILVPFGKVYWHPNNVKRCNTGKEILPTSQIDRSGLFVNYDTRFTDDEFSGVYKDVHFIISETKMKDLSYEKSNYKAYIQQTETEQYLYNYEGIIITFGLKKIVKNRTIVATKRDFTAKNQALYSALMAPLVVLGTFRPPRHASNGAYKVYGIIILIVMIVAICYTYYKEKQKEKNEEPLNRVILEDPKFGKRFKVYSSDQVEARFLVTPAFMEKLYNLKTAFGSKNVKCAFFSNQLMISIATKKDLFEVCNFNKSTKDVIKDFYKELDSIYQMIDYFKLYENLYLTK